MDGRWVVMMISYHSASILGNVWIQMTTGVSRKSRNTKTRFRFAATACQRIAVESGAQKTEKASKKVVVNPDLFCFNFGVVDFARPYTLKASV